MSKNNVKDYGLITLGVLLVAISVVYFFAPNNIAAGGVTGLAIVINHYFPWLTVGPQVLIMNVILYIIAFIVIGSKFGVKSIYASIALSTAMWALDKYLPYEITGDLMLVTIFGTLISAVGMAIVFNGNASTGGTDILAKILNRFFHVNIGKSLLVVDFFVTLLGAITFGINKGLYALLAVIINGMTIDKVIAGFNSKNEIMVISQENEKISRFIMDDLERGCTFLRATGGFTKKETEVLYAVLGRSEFIKLKRFITDVDKNAFITVGEVHEVLGEGFKGIDED